jgi:DNA-binding HxlR family transcriptional regulator
MKPLDDTICTESIRQIMKIFGGKWTFLIIGELHRNPIGFNELTRNLNINTRTLANTLKELETHCIINREIIDTKPITTRYSLTEKGRDFEKVFIEMKNWGAKWLK